jgi:hypothetical protein
MNDMKFNRSQHNNGNENLEDLISYFARTVAHLPEVKLDKLIYIAHLYHYSNCGELLTKTRFFSLSYGPHAPLIRSALKRELERKCIYLTESRTSPDPVHSNPCLIIKSSEQNDKNLSRPCLSTLSEVVEDWGDKPYERILDYATRTIPYLATCYREPIDWTLIRWCTEVKDALSLPQRVQIHKFVKEPEEVMFLHCAHSECGLVSINEVVEIYLALCGGFPDKIPTQEYLGFNLETVHFAFHELRDTDEAGIEKYPTEIDKAAQLAHSLIDSMSFRSYSSRVALQTGILYLKKLGYSFQGDALEHNWPYGNSHKMIKEWLSRVGAKLESKQKST